jgi:hypothetical protein
VGNPGNETADKIAKEAAKSRSVDITYRRIQITFIQNYIKAESVKKWQREWRNCNKALITKQYFPTVEERLKKKIRTTNNVAAMLTGHGRTRAYFHRFRIIDSAQCVCNVGDQTVHHLIYDCILLEEKRRILKKEETNSGHWPISKQELINKHSQTFLNFTESIDFDHL